MNGELPLQINHFPSTFFKRYSDLVSIFLSTKRNRFMYCVRPVNSDRFLLSAWAEHISHFEKEKKSMNVFRHTANHERETRTKKFTDFYY